jgi:hypothetical protein
MKAPASNATTFERVKDGTHIARVYRVIDKGTHEKDYGKGPKNVHQILLSYEFPTQIMTEGEFAGQPFTQHESLTFSMYQGSNLCQRVESILGREFPNQAAADDYDLSDLIGCVCLLQVATTEDGKYTNIVSVVKPPEGMQAPAAVNPPVIISLVDGEFSREAFDALSEKLRETITQSPEYAAVTGGVPGEDIPFN